MNYYLFLFDFLMIKDLNINYKICLRKIGGKEINWWIKSLKIILCLYNGLICSYVNKDNNKDFKLMFV